MRLESQKRDSSSQVNIPSFASKSQPELAIISHSSLVDSLLLLSFFDLSQTIIKTRQPKPMTSGIMKIQNLLSGGA
jgi:hypothetical protein